MSANEHDGRGAAPEDGAIGGRRKVAAETDRVRPATDAATVAADWAAPFDDAFRERLAELLRLRRDVRAFRPDPVDPAVLRACMALAHRAPSVGYAQPWRFVQVTDRARIETVARSFERANAEALAATAATDRALYVRLKLQGIREAPVQMAVFCDEATATGRGLGARTMPETRAYSVVCAIHTLWLALRAHGLGLGWVSILHPQDVSRAVAAPASWRFIAWLCIGHPAGAPATTPELERVGWERREPLEKVWKTL